MNKIFEEVISAEISLCYDMTMDCIHNCIPILIKHLDIERQWIECTRIFEESDVPNLSSIGDNSITFNKSLQKEFEVENEEPNLSPLRDSSFPSMTTLHCSEIGKEFRGFIVIVHFSQMVRAFKRFNISTGILSYAFLKEVIVCLIHEMIHIQQLSGVTPGFSDEECEKYSSSDELIDAMEKYAYANMYEFFNSYKEELDYIIDSCLSKFLILLELNTNYWFTKDRIDLLN